MAFPQPVRIFSEQDLERMLLTLETFSSADLTHINFLQDTVIPVLNSNHDNATLGDAIARLLNILYMQTITRLDQELEREFEQYAQEELDDLELKKEIRNANQRAYRARKKETPRKGRPLIDAPIQVAQEAPHKKARRIKKPR